MEIRAAEIARKMEPVMRGRGNVPRSITADELDGWCRAGRDVEPVANFEHQHMVLAPTGWVKARLAGWMAWQIASHA